MQFPPLFLYAIGLGLTIPVAWSLGANDAANPTACAVGSGISSLRRALIIFALFAGVGAMLEGYMVMKTVDRGIVPHMNLVGAFTVTISVCIWIVLCTWRGLPISTTQTAVGGVIGYGLASYGVDKLNWNVLPNVFIGMVASPVLAIILAILLYYFFRTLFNRFSNKPRLVERLTTYLFIVAVAFASYSFGANDVANATGIFVTVTQESFGLPSLETMLFLSAIGSIGIALGGFTWGYKVIETSGKRICSLDRVLGFSAELAGALSVYLFTVVPYYLTGWGLPVSTTHCSVGAIVGVGLTKGKGAIDKRTMSEIISAWMLTLPCAIALSWGMFKLVSLFIFI